MPDLTPEEIQQAREIARETTNPGKWFTPGHASIALMARAVLALTEQPEQVKRYRIDGPYSNGFELVDTADTVLGTYASRRMVEVECDTLERKHREQSRKDTDV